ncbi:MAG TPA: hypothetical protein VJ453_07195 [Terriglobales bacterium]|jgi:hypothetical protein|nr:hypothetical protein [Terriglobales bacterium]
MPSKRTLNSNSPLDTPEARKVLASIKRDLRRVERDVQALHAAPPDETERQIVWDGEN